MFFSKSIPDHCSFILSLVDLDTMELIEDLKEDNMIAKKVSNSRDAPEFLLY